MNNEKRKLKNLFKHIKLLVSDFDGVFTDGKVYVNQNGKEMVQCSRKDGMGVLLLQKNGIKVVVISYEANPVVKKRCEKMGILCYNKIQSGEGKLDILKRIISKNKLNVKNIAYIGDDINDLHAMEYVGLGITVADAHPTVISKAKYITHANGGQHAVREVAELILKSKIHSIKNI